MLSAQRPTVPDGGPWDQGTQWPFLEDSGSCPAVVNFGNIGPSEAAEREIPRMIAPG